MFGLFRKDPAGLLKKATKAEKNGDPNKAISILGDAYKAISKTSISYSVETFLRLPLYLQKAGRNQEAWEQFESLLSGNYHLASNDPELIPMNQSTILDKMRLFLQRSGSPELAVAYGLASYFSRAQGLAWQRRFDEFDLYAEREAIDDLVANLLKRAKRADRFEAVVAVLPTKRTSISSFEASSIIAAVCQILDIPKQYKA